EHQPIEEWADKALAEKDPAAAVTALLALARAGAQDPQHHKNAKVDEKLKTKLFDRLLKLGEEKLADEQRLDLYRVWQIAMNRMGPPTDKKPLITQLDAQYPAKSREANAELCALLVYLEAPKVVEKTLKLLAEAPTQEEQMEYGRSLRVLKAGWTL